MGIPPSDAGSPPEIGKLPPHSIEAEQGVLGCFMTASSDELGSMIVNYKSLLSRPGIFYDVRHVVIWGVIASLIKVGRPVDLIVLQQNLKDIGQLDDAGGLAYLASLPNLVPSASNVDFYIGIVLDKFTRRKAIQIASALSSNALDDSVPIQGSITSVGNQCYEASRLDGDSRPMTIRSAISVMTDRLERIMSNDSPIVPTGYETLNDVLGGGVGEKEVCILAGRPGMGKTTLAINMAGRIAVELQRDGANSNPGEKYGGRFVDIYTYEQDPDQLASKFVSAAAKMDLIQEIRSAHGMSPDTNPRHKVILEKIALVSNLPIRITNGYGVNIDDLCARIRCTPKTRIVIIDYLTKIPIHDVMKRQDIQSTAAELSEKLRMAAKASSLPLIVLAQMNRMISRDKPRPPRLEDLRDSGCIEQDATSVVILYEPADGNSNWDSPASARMVNARVCKNRGGAKDVDVPLWFTAHQSRFDEPEKKKTYAATN